jgi:hypothetical protein
LFCERPPRVKPAGANQTSEKRLVEPNVPRAIIDGGIQTLLPSRLSAVNTHGKYEQPYELVATSESLT